MDYGAAVVDLDGTVYRGDELLPGADEAVARLRDAGVEVRFVSNNPTAAPADYAAKLDRLGVPAHADDVLTSGSLTAAYLAEEHAGQPTFVVGEGGLIEQLDAVEVVDEPDEAAVVVGSVDRSFDYDDLAVARRALVDPDTTFLATDPDRVIPGPDGPLPGSGAVLAALSAVASREPDAVLGKPSAWALEAIAKRVEAPPGDWLVVGDRLDTDVALGERAGATTALVRSGVTDGADLADSDVTPDHVVASLARSSELLRGS